MSLPSSADKSARPKIFSDNAPERFAPSALCPLTAFTRWLVGQEPEVRHAIAINVDLCLRHDPVYRGLSRRAVACPILQLELWLTQRPADPYQTLARLLLLRGALPLLVFANRTQAHDWHALVEENVHWQARAESVGDENLAESCRHSLVELPGRARMWMEAARSWQQLCNTQLSDEAVQCWLEIAELQE